MSTRVTKAQLQDEVEKLRALVDHLETTNAALQDLDGRSLELIDQLRTDVRAAEERVGEMGTFIEHWAGLHEGAWINTDHAEFMQMARAGFEAKAQQAQQQRVTRKVFEFNPAVPGDFARAMNEARKHNGVVRRMTQ